MPLACDSRDQAALKYDVDVLYHCEYADEEALDQREAKKDKVFVAPTIGFSWAYAYEAEPWGITKEIAERNGIPVTIACDAFRKMRKRGIRALPGAITVLPGTRSATTRMKDGNYHKPPEPRRH
jgi:hypothetical protein